MPPLLLFVFLLSSILQPSLSFSGLPSPGPRAHNSVLAACLTSDAQATELPLGSKSTPTRVLVVRHGETVWNTQSRWQGQQDSPLTLEGVQQAIALGKRLQESGYQIDAVYSSDLMRAKRSAEMLCTSLGISTSSIKVDETMRERRFGIFEGKTRKEVESAYPYELKMYYQSNDATFKVEGGESRAELVSRSLGWLERIGTEHAGETVLVMTHGAVVSSLVRDLLSIPYDPKPIADLRIRNTCICELRKDPGASRWTILSIGDVAHTESITHTHQELGASVEQETPTTISVGRSKPSLRGAFGAVKVWAMTAARSKWVRPLATGVLGFLLGKGTSVGRLFGFM